MVAIVVTGAMDGGAVWADMAVMVVPEVTAALAFMAVINTRPLTLLCREPIRRGSLGKVMI